MQPKRLNPGYLETDLGRVLLHHCHLRQLPAREDLVHDEFDEAQKPHRAACNPRP